METEMAPAAKIVETHLEVWIRRGGEWSPCYEVAHTPREARELASNKARELGLPVVLVSGERDRMTVAEENCVCVAEIMRDRARAGWPRTFERPRQMPPLRSLLGDFGEGIVVLAI